MLRCDRDTGHADLLMPTDCVSPVTARIPSSLITLLLLLLGPSRLRRFPGLLFALFVCESFGRRFTALAAQLYSGGVLLFGHELGITAVPAGEPNSQKVPVPRQ